MAAKKKVSRPGHTPPKRAQEEKGGRRSEGRSEGGKKAFDNTNRGVLFLNDKGDNDARPDYTGVADIEIPEDAKPGSIYKVRLAGWIKESKTGGDDFVSLVIQKADKQGGGRKPRDNDDDGETNEE